MGIHKQVKMSDVQNVEEIIIFRVALVQLIVNSYLVVIKPRLVLVVTRMVPGVQVNI